MPNQKTGTSTGLGSQVHLTVGCGLYDRTLPLAQGMIAASGLSLDWRSLPPRELFNEVLKEKFDVGEMSLAYLCILNASGERRFVGLPIFPSRMFRHSALYVRSDSGLVPDQLRDKRIGVSSYAMTAAVWVRWMLRKDYQILPDQLEWFVGNVSPVPTYSNPQVRLKQITGGHAELEGMLLTGELDVLLSVIPPKSYFNGTARRLWSNSREAERASGEKHGIFPIMHTLVIQRPVLEEHPWVAESLFNAFWEAKELCYRQLLDTDVPYITLPWLCGNVEEAQRLFGRDYWPYGLNANRNVLNTFLEELHVEGLIENRPPLEDIFLPLESREQR